ncbi:MAG: cohesin domain-containing protein, partial [Clostridium sp.]|uniref:cohesin domain-containing protein n=1 Tax=Clostridium sp. TaxID=1506 RepID=UPI003D6D0B4F
MKFKKITIFMLSFLLLTFILTFGSTKANAATASKIYYSLDSSSIKVGQTFNIYVNCENIADLYGASVDFKYDASMLQILNITKGNVFEASGKVYNQVVKTELPDTTGVVSIGLTLKGDIAGFAASGKLFVIQAKALKAGSFNLQTTTDSSKLVANGLNMCVKLADATTGWKIAVDTYDTKKVSITPSFTITGVTTDKSSPIYLGNSVKYTTSVTGSTNTQYKFVAVVNGKSYLLRDFSSPNSFVFKPSGAKNYKVVAYAKNLTTGSIVSKELSLVVSVPPFNITGVTTDKSSPISLGNSVKYTTLVTGSTSTQYKFVAVVNGVPYLLRDFSSPNSFVFKPSGAKNYKVVAYAKNLTTGSIVSKELSLVVSAPFNITGVTTDKSSPISLGNSVKYTTSVTGSTNTQYKFVAVVNGKSYLLRDFSSPNSFV